MTAYRHVFSPFRPLFWVIFCGFSITAIIFNIHYFSQAFPIVDATISITREDAIKQAEELAHRYGFLPENARTVAWFDTNNTVQYYAELKAGGVEVFKKLLHDPDFSPYTWQVRLFKENTIEEAFIEFTPTGKPYGFVQKIPLDEPGAALSSQEASALLKRTFDEWQFDLSSYQLVEEAHKTNPAGRVDHTFTYEHTSKKLEDAPYRIIGKVMGNRVCQLTHSIKVPEIFLQSYQEMRSANNLIASIANQFVYGLYFFIGGILGLIFLARRRFLLWKYAFLWALGIAGFTLLEQLNSLPLIWRSYDTSTSLLLFLVNHFISSIGNTTITFGLFFIIFLVAEGLTRAAFGNHYQFWKSWFSSGAGSLPIVGRMIAAYMWVPIDLSLVIITYFIAAKWFGWWSPSGLLYNPNILATYFPWFESISRSFSAGFTEECLFRAIPLAGAALLGKRFGGQKWWIGIAFVLQAIIFGAAHANYPAQPAYARLIELIIPSFIFGFFYLRYGLIVSIILHFTYDVFWFSLPLWVATTPYIWGSRLLVIFFTLLPLLYGLFFKIKSKDTPIPLNNTWEAPQKKNKAPLLPYDAQTIPTGSRLSFNGVLIFGCMGGLLLYLSGPFKPDVFSIEKTRDQALSQARTIFQEHTIHQEQPWELLSFIGSSVTNCYSYPDQVSASLQSLFIWREHKEQFSALINNYLTVPSWKIRRVRFSGTTQERAEQYVLSLYPKGTLHQLCHIIAEQTPGANLTEVEAKKLAENHVKKLFYDVNINKLINIASIPSKKPARTDWLFIWQDPTINVDPGQARILIHLAGDMLVDAYQFIFVPQTWQRTYIYEQNILSSIKLVSKFLVLIFVLLAIGLLALTNIHQYPSLRLFIMISSISFVWSLISLWDQWPSRLASFNTTSPYIHQLFTTLSWSILQSGAIILIFTSLMLLIIYHLRVTSQKSSSLLVHALTGGMISLAVLGTVAFTGSLLPKLAPTYSSILYLSGRINWISVIDATIHQFIIWTVGTFMALLGLNRITNRGKRSMTITLSLIFIASGVFAAHTFIESISSWLVYSLVFGLIATILYYLVLRFDYEPLFYLIAGLIAFNQFKIALNSPFGYAWSLFGLSVLILGFLIILSHFLTKKAAIFR